MVQFQVESIDLTKEWNTTSRLMKVPRVPLRMDTSEVVDYLPVLKLGPRSLTWMRMGIAES